MQMKNNFLQNILKKKMATKLIRTESELEKFDTLCKIEDLVALKPNSRQKVQGSKS